MSFCFVCFVFVFFLLFYLSVFWNGRNSICKLHANIKRENLAFLVAVFDPEMLRVRPKEWAEDRVNAAHLPLCEQHADARSTVHLGFCHAYMWRTAEIILAYKWQFAETNRDAVSKTWRRCEQFSTNRRPWEKKRKSVAFMHIWIMHL